MTDTPVLIAGAGPVGLVAAARLVQAGIPVTVLEAGEELNRQSRASTFHPPTLDMLGEIGVVDAIIAQGLKAPWVQYRNRQDGMLGRFDFGEIADLTNHPYRLQCEQWRLTRALADMLADNPLFTIEYGSRVESVEQNADGATATLEGGRTKQTRWLIGADGASSAVRQSLNIGFDGFTWPERFLVLTTTHDVRAILPDVDPVTYVADPQIWNFFLEIPGRWRIMFPTPAEMDDETALSEEHAKKLLDYVLPQAKDLPIEHRTLYRVHQRVADTFRLGSVFLAGDAAHINNPLGGMGMNGGIHDAVSLTDKLIAVLKGNAPESELDRYDAQRRQVTVEHVQTTTISNKRDLEAKSQEDRRRYADAMRERMKDAEKRRAFLKRIAMYDALERASQLG